MSHEAAGLQRVIHLYHEGLSINAIARDGEVASSLLAGLGNERSRAWRIWRLVRRLTDAGTLPPREKPFSQALDEQEERAFARHLKKYEALLGLPARTQAPVGRGKSEQYVVVSDLHIPDERGDFLAEIARRHAGLDLYIAGDVHDWENFSRWDSQNWAPDRMKDLLARTEALFCELAKHFPRIYVLWGNHDWRPVKRAAKALGPEYGWITQQFLMWVYERWPGVNVITHPAGRRGGEGLHFFHQIGDCVIGHVERSGSVPSRGAQHAHDFYWGFREALGIEPFRTVLQAHTHKTSYYRHPMTGVHCYEIGCLCEVPDYALRSQKFQRPQCGYFLLTQRDGVTDLNESRLYTLD